MTPLSPRNQRPLTMEEADRRSAHSLGSVMLAMKTVPPAHRQVIRNLRKSLMDGAVSSGWVRRPSDGKIPDGPANQNSNPNVGLASKRAAGPGGADQPPVKTVPGQVRSVLTPRSAASSEQYNVQPIRSLTNNQSKWTIKARLVF